MGKRTYSSKFKAELVLEALREEEHLSEIAAGYGINPNMLRNWKKEFLEKAPGIFDKSRQEKELLNKEQEMESEREEMLRTIGQLTIERDWLKKKSVEAFGHGYEKKFDRKPS
jgi:transposase-like protein